MDDTTVPQSSPTHMLSRAGISIVLAVLFFAGFNRSIETAFATAFGAAVMSPLFGIPILAYEWCKDRDKSWKNLAVYTLALLGSLTVGPLVVAVAIVLIMSVGSGLWVAFEAASSFHAPTVRAGAVSAIVLFIGILLFVFRCRYRSLYGATEILAGIIVGMMRTWAGFEVGTELFVVLLTASVYLIVRGLDNVQQGLMKPPFDPIAGRFKQLRFFTWLVSLAEQREGYRNL
jgi:hypothetical protein